MDHETSEVAPAEVSRAIARARRGASIDPREALALLSARGEQVEEILAIAGDIRDKGLESAGRPGTITWSPKVFIPLTRLCRDRCHYCTFATDPASLRRSGHGMYLDPDEVLAIARTGALLGCTEALFTLGDRPEDRWPAAREWLSSRGFDDTLSYVRAMAILVLEETGLLPHLNPGVMSWEEMARLKPVAPSMGMMLETTSTRLFTTPGAVHHGSPDKDPAARLAVLEDAGRLNIPFTTGLLIGIGETLAERVDGIFAIRAKARAHGHIQEVIIQNFRAKPDTAMRTAPDLGLADYALTLAVSRIILGPRMRLQAPPNLTDAEELEVLLRAGVDDWGGVSPVTPDHVNPERPWPHLDELRARTEAAGFTLAARLTAHPEYVRKGDPWIDPRVRPHVLALADGSGLAAEPRQPQGRAWQEPDDLGYDTFADRNSGGRVDLNSTIDTDGRTGDRRSDFDEVYGDWSAISADSARVAGARTTAPNSSGGAELRAALSLAESDPAALAEEANAAAALLLMEAEGTALDELCRIADDVRRDTVGDDITYVVNRNINFTNVCYTGCRFCAFAQRKSDADAFTLSLEQIKERVREARAAGATEICMQGGIHPDLPGTAYFDLARAVKQADPGIHLHAFSPMEIVNGASKSGLSVREWLQEAKSAGVDSIPGTAAEILDDEVRWILTKGKLPASTWMEVVATAHEVGIPSSSTMMYGHVDAPHHWVAHLRTLRRLQDRTGGFTEFVALPFIHHNAPVYLAGIARPGPTARDNRAVHAMARLMLHGSIRNIQCSWVKLGDDGCLAVLAGGVNDLGGTLMEETISRMAGSEHGSSKTVSELRAIADRAGRPARQRSTTYA